MAFALRRFVSALRFPLPHRGSQGFSSLTSFDGGQNASIHVWSRFKRRQFLSNYVLESPVRGGAFSRTLSTSSGTSTLSASAKAAAEAADIRDHVQQAKTANEDETETAEGGEKVQENGSERKGRERVEPSEVNDGEIVDEKLKTLRAALAHVPKLGWTEAAMIAGARDVGLSPAIVGAFQRKEAALVEFFMDEAALALTEEVEDRNEELAKMVMHDRLAAIVWIRLEMMIPYLSKWAQALSIQANPVNVPATLKQRAHLVDDIWHAAGDRSADMDWYAKRALLAGVYSATELYMLTDSSPGFRDTKAFLGRQLTNAIDWRKSVQEATQLAQAVGVGFQNTLTSLLTRSRSPPNVKL